MLSFQLSGAHGVLTVIVSYSIVFSEGVTCHLIYDFITYSNAEQLLLLSDTSMKLIILL